MTVPGCRSLAALCFGVLLAFVGVASVQAQDRDVRGGAAGEFDFYVLALSWSPGFCSLEGDRKERDQCRSGAGLGFVVHGLWPQNERGYPTECGPAGRFPTRQAIDAAKAIFPAEGLARYQWRKHGTCAGTSPTEYFADVKRARAAVVIPPEFASVDTERTLSPQEIERAFVGANRGLRSDMMSVACRRGQLQEVRICFTKDLRSFRTCEEVDRGGCRTRDIVLQPMR